MASEVAKSLNRHVRSEWRSLPCITRTAPQNARVSSDHRPQDPCKSEAKQSSRCASPLQRSLRNSLDFGRPHHRGP